MPQHLLFVESNTTGTGRLFMRAARAEGCEPVLVAKNPALYPFAAEEAVTIIAADTGNEAALLELCKNIAKQSGLAGVTSTSDYFVSTAARLAENLGLPGPSVNGITNCRDKEIQYRTLSAAGVRVPATEFADSGRDAAQAARRIGFPVVVKPVSGSGSVGVRLCASEQEVADHAEILLSRRTNERGMPVRQLVLVQALIEGPEFSVESLAGEIVGITRKYVSAAPVFIEMGHDFPANLAASAVTGIVGRALAALDLQWGAAHTELRIAAEGPTIIEVNPRLAGGFIPELVRLASGVDLIRQLTRRIAGKDVRIEPERQHHASIRFLVPPRCGTLLDIEGQDTARAVPDVREVSIYRGGGAELVLAGDFHDRIGHVIAAAHEPGAARDSAERALALLSVKLN